ncbi:MAG TPA: DNA recombination protein RmuC [Chlamydiales bacterium]|nr:DNA recombination protein RmuC [Chlamydiales bacterium]
MILLGFAGLLAGFIGLWFWMQKKVDEAQKGMQEGFKALSFEVMEKSSRSFLDLAKTSLEKFQEGAKSDLEQRQKSIDATLKQIDLQQRELEKKREGAYVSLSQQIEGMLASEKDLRKETAHLVQALRAPQMRGSWGEMHLRRVVELAGMLNNCDFFEQKSVEAEGKTWRPDLVVRLPGQRHIAVDAKTPLNAYLDASDAGDDLLRKKKLQDHAASLRKHVKDLSAKEYWKQFECAPEFVILFLPAEAFFSAALQADPTLIEVGADQNIVFATPTTLIAILRAVAFSWKQEGLSKSAREIARLGQELYERVGTVCDHWNKVGKNLNTAVEAYNQSVASFETRVLVTARKLKETNSLTKEFSEPEKIDKLAKTIEI